MMKIRVFICLVLATVVVVTPTYALDVSTQIQMLDSNIRKLELEKREKMAELENCARGVNGFRIAGITTLGLTAVGIGVNIAQASKKSTLNRQIDVKEQEIEKRQRDIAAMNLQKQAEDAELARLRAEADELKQRLRDCEADGSCDDEEDDVPVNVPDEIVVDDKEYPVTPPVEPNKPVTPVTPPTPECIDGRTESCTFDGLDSIKRGTRTCIDGQWGDCIPEAECTKGSTMGCGNGQVKRCIDGKWGDCESECLVGLTMGCGAGMLKTCIDGRWSDCMPITRTFRDTCEAHQGVYRHNTRSVSFSYCYFSDKILTATPNRTETQADCTNLCNDVFVGTGLDLGQARFSKGITGRAECACYPR